MKQAYHIRTQCIRQNAINAVLALPIDERKPYIVTLQQQTRSLEQNAKMWAVLSDIAHQVIWYGNRLTTDEWKDFFSAALKKQKVVPDIDGTGFIALGKSTSNMSIKAMSELIELATVFGVQNGVEFGDQARCAIEWAKRFGDGE